MELRDIEYFAMLARHGHLGRAAEALDLSTAAISKSLRRLEAVAGTKLVRRTPKGIDLTAVGQALLQHVRPLRLAHDDTVREVADLASGRAGHIRLGTGPATAETTLPDACARLMMEAPKVSLSTTISNNDQMVPELRNGQLDIIVHFAPQFPLPGLVNETLWQDEHVVVASEHHRLARHRRVTLQDLVEERWSSTAAAAFLTWQSLLRKFEKAALPPPQIVLITESNALRLRTVAQTNLLAFIPKRVIEFAPATLRLTILPVKEVQYIQNVVMLYRKDGYLSPAVLRFIDILKSIRPKRAEKTAPV
jgi:DNA-binding transcriptional LysR family regulator